MIISFDIEQYLVFISRLICIIYPMYRVQFYPNFIILMQCIKISIALRAFQNTHNVDPKVLSRSSVTSDVCCVTGSIIPHVQ